MEQEKVRHQEGASNPATFFIRGSRYSKRTINVATLTTCFPAQHIHPAGSLDRRLTSHKPGASQQQNGTMQRASPSPARSYDVASPHRADLAEIFNQNRNSPARHRQILETSRQEHTRIREEAERVLQEARLKEERDRVLEQRRKEEERIKTEQELAAERVRLNELKAKKIEIPPLLPDPEPPKPAPKPTPPAAVSPANKVDEPKPTSVLNGAGPFGSTAPTAQPSSGFFAAKAPPAPTPSPSPPVPAVAPAAKPANSVLGIGGLLNGTNQTNGTAGTTGAVPAALPVAPTAPAVPTIDRYTVIHKNLKGLRKMMAEQAKTNRALKERMGDMRRELRKCIGQLSAGAPGVNRSQARTPRRGPCLKIRFMLTV